MSTDPYAHLPQLRHCLTPAEQSELRVTPELLLRWDERARDLGRGADWRQTDAQLDASRRALLGALDGGQELWIYAYGSLMWDPGFHFAEVRMALLAGHRRRFSYRTTYGRGAPDCPGLMLSLEPGDGDCHGLAFRIDAASAAHEAAVVWRREMLRGGYCPCLLPLSTPQGELTALVFAANTAHADHVGEQPLDATAATIARASGLLGSNRQYLEQLVQQLDRLDIEDAYLRQLLARVCSLDGP